MTHAQYLARLRILFRNAMNLVDNEDRIKRAILENFVGSTEKSELVSNFDLSELETNVVEHTTKILNAADATKVDVFIWVYGKRFGR